MVNSDAKKRISSMANFDRQRIVACVPLHLKYMYTELKFKMCQNYIVVRLMGYKKHFSKRLY